jgi:hypothetical protein
MGRRYGNVRGRAVTIYREAGIKFHEEMLLMNASFF